ncbi:MAG: hypothetical protein C5B51_02030 [Terriglobia bacterium]|nr:MAG: hypothetical protein C5B51_02030 [Terriglobia bacterium]
MRNHLARSDRTDAWGERLRRLAGKIDTLADTDQHRLNHAREIAELRRRAATQLHSICAGFVGSVNRLLSRCEVTLDPPHFLAGSFQEEGTNLFQINTRGRILQIEFSATQDLTSTEDFRIPYTIEGSVRAFNQDLLDRNRIEEQLIFFTVEKGRTMWRFFDARTYRSGPLDQEYLLILMEQLI